MQALHADAEPDASRALTATPAWLAPLRATGAWMLVGAGILQFVAATAVLFLPPRA